MNIQIRMADVFGLPVTAEQHDECNGWWTVDTARGLPIDESGDGGFEQETAEAIATALNNHDRLSAENEVLRKEVERLRASNDSLRSIANSLKDQNADYFEQVANVEQERDRMKAKINDLTAAISMSGVYKTSEELCDLMQSTPVHCLAAHDADVIEQAAAHSCSVTEEGDLAVNYHSALMHYADQLRQQNTEEN